MLHLMARMMGAKNILEIGTLGGYSTIWLGRALPPGGEVTRNYRFQGEGGSASFADLFGDKQTLVVYSYMFGPQRERVRIQSQDQLRSARLDVLGDPVAEAGAGLHPGPHPRLGGHLRARTRPRRLPN